MNKKNDKRLCWNCEGNVSHHIAQCPYCGVDLSQPPPPDTGAIFKGYGNPFQSASQQGVPQPPYAKNPNENLTVMHEEWNTALQEEKEEKENVPRHKPETIALLLLLPGIVFLLFGIVLVFFSKDGVLTLKWNQNVAYFYFLGGGPLLYLGWRALNNKTNR